MATTAQVLANRANAQHSTGPRSDAGKAAASQNATSHGLSSSSFALLPHENEEDFIHLGEVAIITQNSEQPITLDVLEGFASDGWEEAEYDLSPYSGQLVYLVWHYVFFSFDGGERPGWLIDDISVTVSQQPVGTLIVTSTLAQATFTIEGPQNLVGQGNSLIVTNAAGCGSAMKDYGELFEGDPKWAARARGNSQKVRDLSEVLVARGEPRDGRSPFRSRVVYHEACRLAHGHTACSIISPDSTAVLTPCRTSRSS